MGSQKANGGIVIKDVEAERAAAPAGARRPRAALRRSAGRAAACAPASRPPAPHSPARAPVPHHAATDAGKGKGKVGEADAQMDADEEFARALQAKMDAEMRAK